MNNKYKLFAVSGHSGSGKTSVMRQVMDNELLSFTTRDRRVNEVNGIDYNFISLEEYNIMKDNGGLAEWTEYADKFYGLTAEEVYSKLKDREAFAVVDANGMLQLDKFYGNVVKIFIYTDYDVAYRNMKSRGDKEELILKRLETYEEEIKNRHLYDYVIKNIEGNFGNTVEIFQNIILSEVNS